MRVLNMAGLSLQCDADQMTQGDALAQARQALDLINLTLQREPYGLGAQIMVHASELRAEFEQLEGNDDAGEEAAEDEARG